MSVLLLVRPVAVSICLPGMLDRGCIIFVDFWPKGERTRKKCAAGIGLLILILGFGGCQMPGSGSGTGGSTSKQIGFSCGVAVSGTSGNVYISGMTGMQTGSTSYGWPSYWENGTLTTMYVAADSYFWVGWNAVSDADDVFVAGATGSSNDAPIACYWEGATQWTLPMGWVGGTYSLAFNAAYNRLTGVVYLIGEIGASSTAVAPCYWVGNGGSSTI